MVEIKDLMGELHSALAGFAQKMPASEAQRIKWLIETRDEIYEKLTKSGIDKFSLIGLLESIKQKMLRESEKGEDLADIMLSMKEENPV